MNWTGADIYARPSIHHDMEDRKPAPAAAPAPQSPALRPVSADSFQKNSIRDSLPGTGKVWHEDR